MSETEVKQSKRADYIRAFFSGVLSGDDTQEDRRSVEVEVEEEPSSSYSDVPEGALLVHLDGIAFLFPEDWTPPGF